MDTQIQTQVDNDREGADKTDGGREKKQKDADKMEVSGEMSENSDRMRRETMTEKRPEVTRQNNHAVSAYVSKN